jgi:hypothetical protein
MSSLLSRIRTWRWPARVAAVGVAAGALGFLMSLGTTGGQPRLLALFASLWLGWGASSAAALLLAGTAVERLRRRPLALDGSRAPRLVVALTGASLLGLGLVFLTVAIAEEIIVLVGLGAGAAVVAARDRHAPWPARRALALVALALVAFAAPREAGWFSISNNRAHTDTRRHVETSSRCNGTNWNGPLNVPALARDLVVWGGLTGNVGERVRFEDRDVGDGTLELQAMGDVDVGWLGCLLPLVKTASFDASLFVSGGVHVSAGGGAAFCSVSGTVTLHVETSVHGVASCRDVRQALARQIATELEEAGRSLL